MFTTKIVVKVRIGYLVIVFIDGQRSPKFSVDFEVTELSVYSLFEICNLELIIIGFVTRIKTILTLYKNQSTFSNTINITCTAI